MSQSAAARATQRPTGRPLGRAAPGGPRLRVVTAPTSGPSWAGLVAWTLVALVAGLVALLLFNVSLAHGSYALRDRQREQTELLERRQALQEEISQLEAPQTLEQRARTLGMVPDPRAVFLDPDHGVVRGDPAPAPTPDPTP
ncbi:MAG: hypothetical protein QG608_3455 [Actinomycetota bacterium]|nr:hypothetical protein [Actinomycetota bacterium]